MSTIVNTFAMATNLAFSQLIWLAWQLQRMSEQLGPLSNASLYDDALDEPMAA